jgi:hypothetical protein
MIHVFISIFLGLLFAAVIVAHQLATPSFYTDFAQNWNFAVLALNHPELLYDQASPLPYPCGYPPTFIVFFTPFAFLPLPVGYFIWVLGSLTLFICIATYLFDEFKPLGIALLILAPPVWTAALLGQAALLIGVLLLTALIVMPNKKFIAGLMIGIAATVKPQTMVMAPIALLAIRDWRVIAWTTATAVANSMIATIIFGFNIWLDWLDALPRFLAYQAMINQVQISLWALTSRSPSILLVVTMLAIFIVWTTVRATNRADHRLVAIVGGAWLVSPYVPVYELAMIAPAIIAFVLQEIGSIQPLAKRWRSYIGIFAVFVPPLSIFFTPVFLILNTLVVVRKTQEGTPP